MSQQLYRLLLALTILGGAPWHATAQVMTVPAPGAQPQPASTESAGLSEPEPPRTTSPAPQARGPLLERPVNRNEYVLGPADLLSLAIFGFRSEAFDLMVTPEGSVVIPGIGVATVAGLNLNQAEQVVARLVRRFYQDVDVRLSLLAVRSFKVFLIGNSPDPGVREATAVTRVSELIQPLDSAGVIHRRVVIERAGGQRINVDLARFLQLGELLHNPILREGDVVRVSAIDETITVSGQVAFPGTYEFKGDESLADLLLIANAGEDFRADAADTIQLLRFTARPEGEIVALQKSDAVGAIGRALRLQPFDAIFVPKIGRFKLTRTATVDGEVRRPGSYPIQPDVTTILDLVQMAGGFTPDASLPDALLHRVPVVNPNADTLITNTPTDLLSRADLRILQASQLTSDRNLVIDLNRLVAEGAVSAENFTLEAGDFLFVPERRLEVVVLGAVSRPGIVAFSPGQSVDFFVGKAGGYTVRADVDDVVVTKARTGTRLYRKEVTTLEPGDKIIVPFSEQRTLFQRIQSAQGVITTVTGVILTVVGVSQLWDNVTN